MKIEQIFTFNDNSEAILRPSFWINVELVRGKMFCQQSPKVIDLKGVNKIDFLNLFEGEDYKELSVEKIIPRQLYINFSRECASRCFHQQYHECSELAEEVLDNFYDDINPIYYEYKELFNVEEQIRQKTMILESLPELTKDLYVLKIQGGEPLIQKELEAVLDFLDNNPRPLLDLHITTQLMVSLDQSKKIFDRIENLVERGHLKKSLVFCFLDSFDSKNPYFDKVEVPLRKSVENLLLNYRYIGVRVNYALSIFSYKGLESFMSDFLALYSKSKELHPQKDIYFSPASASAQGYPQMFGLSVLGFEKMKEVLSEIKRYQNNESFKDFEKDFNCVKAHLEAEIKEIELGSREKMNFYNRAAVDFYYYCYKIDKGNGSSLSNNYPELKDVYANCRKLFFDPTIGEPNSRYAHTKELLDLESGSLCLAKWNHVTLHLHSGANPQLSSSCSS